MITVETVLSLVFHTHPLSKRLWLFQRYIVNKSVMIGACTHQSAGQAKFIRAIFGPIVQYSTEYHCDKHTF
jgi:hypothetical protein